MSPNRASSTSISKTERALRFVDNVSTQTLGSIVGGLVGTFLDGRYFAILSILVSLGLYRSKALEGVRHKFILPIHILSVSVTAACLFWMGVELNKSRPQTFTPNDYVNAVKGNMPLPIKQQITNIYNSHVSTERQIGEPRIDFSEFLLDGFEPRGAIFYTNAINNGSIPALDKEGTSMTLFAERSGKSEDALFRLMQTRVDDSNQPRSDLPPGPRYSAKEISVVPLMTPQQKEDYQSRGKVLYVGRIDSYRDAKGNKYQSELCMFISAQSPTLIYCDGHNRARKLGGN